MPAAVFQAFSARTGQVAATGTIRNADVSSLPFRIRFGTPEFHHQAVLGRENIFDIEGSEFGAAEAAGEAEEQERAVAAAGECIRQSVEHAANVGSQQRSFGVLRGAERPPDPLQRFADRWLLHGSGRGLAGNLMGFGDGGQAPGHGRRPMGGGKCREIQGYGFGAGRQWRHRRAAAHQRREMLPIGAVGPECRGSFGGAKELLGLVMEQRERRGG